jgi:hypothetical protein
MRPAAVIEDDRGPEFTLRYPSRVSLRTVVRVRIWEALRDLNPILGKNTEDLGAKFVDAVR